MSKNGNYLDREDVYYVDRWKRIWIQREGKLIRPERFDIYCHICKRNRKLKFTIIIPLLTVKFYFYQ